MILGSWKIDPIFAGDVNGMCSRKGEGDYVLFIIGTKPTTIQ